jgi:cytochrome c oxidase assembly protein subunit 15
VVDVPRLVHRLAAVLAGATLILIFVGGLVTSTGSGLAVPDWPLSFGGFFPRMVGGVFYEHGHRMVAAAVGFATLLLAMVAWRFERRRTVRRLAFAAIATVVAQGLLGGLTVILLLPPAVSVAHACLAQAFLCLTVALAVVSDPRWDGATALPRRPYPNLAAVACGTTAAVYVQLILGAVMRHTGAGLAIPDFPLAFGGLVPPFERPGVAIHFAHRLGAVGVAALVAWSVFIVRTHYAAERALARPARLAGLLVIAQVSLGALTVWTGKAVLPTTAHVAVGAALLATTFALALRSVRLVPFPRRTPAPLLADERVPA